jgi:hypothetical protein
MLFPPQLSLVGMTEPRIQEWIYLIQTVTPTPAATDIAADPGSSRTVCPGVSDKTLSSPEFPSVFDRELPTSLSDGFVADCDAELGQKSQRLKHNLCQS